MNTRKVMKICLIIGVALIVAGPILGFFLEKFTIESRGPDNPIVIQETSATTIRDAYHKEISLSRNQRIIIEFAASYPEVSIDLIILGKGTYDQEYAADNAPPASGLDFVYSQFTWGQSPSSSATSATSASIINEGYWYIEFAGDVSAFSNYLISRPGTYVVVVTGLNTGIGTNVTFNLVVKVDGPGKFLESLFFTIGIIILACCAILFAYSYLNKLRRGL